MRTSLNEIKRIEAFLLQQQSQEDALLMETNLLLKEELRQKVALQQKTYRLIRSYGRSKLKEEIAAVHQQLFTAPKHQSFRNKIFRIFFKA